MYADDSSQDPHSLECASETTLSRPLPTVQKDAADVEADSAEPNLQHQLGVPAPTPPTTPVPASLPKPDLSNPLISNPNVVIPTPVGNLTTTEDAPADSIASSAHIEIPPRTSDTIATGSLNLDPTTVVNFKPDPTTTPVETSIIIMDRSRHPSASILEPSSRPATASNPNSNPNPNPTISFTLVANLTVIADPSIDPTTSVINPTPYPTIINSNPTPYPSIINSNPTSNPTPYPTIINPTLNPNPTSSPTIIYATPSPTIVYPSIINPSPNPTVINSNPEYATSSMPRHVSTIAEDPRQHPPASLPSSLGPSPAVVPNPIPKPGTSFTPPMNPTVVADPSVHPSAFTSSPSSSFAAMSYSTPTSSFTPLEASTSCTLLETFTTPMDPSLRPSASIFTPKFSPTTSFSPLEASTTPMDPSLPPSASILTPKFSHTSMSTPTPFTSPFTPSNPSSRPSITQLATLNPATPLDLSPSLTLAPTSPITSSVSGHTATGDSETSSDVVTAPADSMLLSHAMSSLTSSLYSPAAASKGGRAVLSCPVVHQPLLAALSWPLCTWDDGHAAATDAHTTDHQALTQPTPPLDSLRNVVSSQNVNTCRLLQQPWLSPDLIQPPGVCNSCHAASPAAVVLSQAVSTGSHAVQLSTGCSSEQLQTPAALEPALKPAMQPDGTAAIGQPEMAALAAHLGTALFSSTLGSSSWIESAMQSSPQFSTALTIQAGSTDTAQPFALAPTQLTVAATTCCSVPVSSLLSSSSKVAVQQTSAFASGAEVTTALVMYADSAGTRWLSPTSMAYCATSKSGRDSSQAKHDGFMFALAVQTPPLTGTEWIILTDALLPVGKTATSTLQGTAPAAAALHL